jgi:hypothetical protein
MQAERLIRHMFRKTQSPFDTRHKPMLRKTQPRSGFLTNVTNLTKSSNLEGLRTPQSTLSFGSEEVDPSLLKEPAIERCVNHSFSRARQHRPAPLHLLNRVSYLRTSELTGASTDSTLPPTPALTSCSRSFVTTSPEEPDVDVGIYPQVKIYNPNNTPFTLATTTAFSDQVPFGRPSLRKECSQIFSPMNKMGYLTSPQGAQAGQKCNEEISDAFFQMKCDYEALVRDWPRDHAAYSIKISWNLGMRWWVSFRFILLGREIDPVSLVISDSWEEQLRNLITETLEYFVSLSMIDRFAKA